MFFIVFSIVAIYWDLYNLRNNFIPKAILECNKIKANSYIWFSTNCPPGRELKLYSITNGENKWNNQAEYFRLLDGDLPIKDFEQKRCTPATAGASLQVQFSNLFISPSMKPIYTLRTLLYLTIFPVVSSCNYSEKKSEPVRTVKSEVMRLDKLKQTDFVITLENPISENKNEGLS